MNFAEERKLSPDPFLPKPSLCTLDIIVWAKASGVHPSFVSLLLECTYHPVPNDAHQHLEQAKECLARAQASISEGDRSLGDYWELRLYETIQKINLSAGSTDDHPEVADK